MGETTCERELVKDVLSTSIEGRFIGRDRDSPVSFLECVMDVRPLTAWYERCLRRTFGVAAGESLLVRDPSVRPTTVDTGVSLRGDGDET